MSKPSEASACDRIPTEVWSMVFRHLGRPLPRPHQPGVTCAWKDLHQQDLTSVARVSSNFHRIATPILYHTAVTKSIPDFWYGLEVLDKPRYIGDGLQIFVTYPNKLFRRSMVKEESLKLVKNLYIEMEDLGEEEYSENLPDAIRSARIENATATLRLRNEALSKYSESRKGSYGQIIGEDLFNLDRLVIGAFGSGGIRLSSIWHLSLEWNTYSPRKNSHGQLLRRNWQEQYNIYRRIANWDLLILFPAKKMCQRTARLFFAISTPPNNVECVSVHEHNDHIDMEANYHYNLRRYYHQFERWGTGDPSSSVILPESSSQLADLDFEIAFRSHCLFANVGRHDTNRKETFIITRPKLEVGDNPSMYPTPAEDSFESYIELWRAGSTKKKLNLLSKEQVNGKSPLICLSADEVDPCPACGYIQDLN